MKYYFPFGEELKPLKQQDRTPKKVFVLGVIMGVGSTDHFLR